MSILDDKTRIEGAKSGIKDWLISKNVSVPDGARLDDMAELLSTVYLGNPVACGTFTLASEAEYYTVTHGLGVVPDFIFIICTDTAYNLRKESRRGASAWNISGELVQGAVNSGMIYAEGAGNVLSTNMLRHDMTSTNDTYNYGVMVYDATADDFKYGRQQSIQNYKLHSGKQYFWIAVGGLL